jgi:hypothetical protein
MLLKGSFMKPNLELKAEFIDNKAQFNHEFFNRFVLKNNSEPLQLSEKVEKDYLFPTFFHDVSCSMGVFLCSYEKASELLPKNLKPVRANLKQALIVFSCYEYKNVYGISPYNEIAITIPVLNKNSFPLPLLPLVIPAYKNFGYYVVSMPVTSKENLLRGHKIWGIPKVLEEIQINISSDTAQTRCYDETGQLYLELNIPTKGSAQHFDVASNLYSVKDQELLESQTCFKGDFQITKDFSRLMKTPQQQNNKVLSIFSGGSSEKLNALEIDHEPFQTRFCPSMNACFNLAHAKFDER